MCLKPSFILILQKTDGFKQSPKNVLLGFKPITIQTNLLVYQYLDIKHLVSVNIQ